MLHLLLHVLSADNANGVCGDGFHLQGMHVVFMVVPLFNETELLRIDLKLLLLS